MAQSDNIDCDILVIGAGFAGSLTALCLRQAGFEVCVVEKESHPRFAIGESSTPIADMILRDLADTYDLPWLKHFSRYGSWQQHYPDITCGLKRGFSYFKHHEGKEFSTNDAHQNELLVAASVSDDQSDTNWLRAEFDSFLAEKLREYGIPYLDETEITGMKLSNRWAVRAEQHSETFYITSHFFIDATGSPHLLNRFLNIRSGAESFQTKSRALFTHFEGVKKWEEYLSESGIPISDYPYRADFSALHHLLKDAWMWMLHFNDGRSSAGIMLDMERWPAAEDADPDSQWNRILKSYPSLLEMYEHARYAKPPGLMLQTGRLQRKLEKAAGSNWAALPHTAGFVDPMHSTGIAHTLSGIEKLLTILTEKFNDREQRISSLLNYQYSLFKELKFIDTLVAGSYDSINHFSLFNSYVMLYFVAAIRYEQTRLKGHIPSHFLCADDPAMEEILNTSYKELKELVKGSVSGEEAQKFQERVRQRIQPYNSAGLLDPKAHNMYHHTAIDLR